MKYDCKVLNEKLIRLLRPSTPALGIKYIKTEEQLRVIKNINMLAKRGGACTLIGSAIAFNKSFGIRVNNISNMCGGASGCCSAETRKEFLSGSRLITFNWHSDIETAHQHMLAAEHELPECDTIALAVSPLSTGDMTNPDVIILSLEPGAAYHLLAGYEENHFDELNFTFRGEATCVESWNRTYVTGKPGLTLGDRGNRNVGALAANEIRLTLTVSDFARALDGVERLAANGVIYPYGVTHTFPECEPLDI